MAPAYLGSKNLFQHTFVFYASHTRAPARAPVSHYWLKPVAWKRKKEEKHLYTNEWQEDVVKFRKTCIKQLHKKVCFLPVEARNSYTSCYATKHPARQAGSLLLWFEVNAVTPAPTQPAAQLIDPTSMLLFVSSVCFPPGSSCHPLFPAPLCQFTFSFWWNWALCVVLIKSAGGHV